MRYLFLFLLLFLVSQKAIAQDTLYLRDKSPMVKPIYCKVVDTNELFIRYKLTNSEKDKLYFITRNRVMIILHENQTYSYLIKTEIQLGKYKYDKAINQEQKAVWRINRDARRENK